MRQLRGCQNRNSLPNPLSLHDGFAVCLFLFSVYTVRPLFAQCSHLGLLLNSVCVCVYAPCVCLPSRHKIGLCRSASSRSATPDCTNASCRLIHRAASSSNSSSSVSFSLLHFLSLISQRPIRPTQHSHFFFSFSLPSLLLLLLLSRPQFHFVLLRVLAATHRCRCSR